MLFEVKANSNSSKTFDKFIFSDFERKYEWVSIIFLYSFMISDELFNPCFLDKNILLIVFLSDGFVIFCKRIVEYLFIKFE